MKKLIFVAILFFVISCVIIEIKDSNLSINVPKEEKFEEKRGIFISYLEYLTYFNGKTPELQKSYIEKMVDNVYENGFNMIILHVSPFSDSIYKSSILPYSYTLTGTEGKDPGFDFLDYFLKLSHSKNIEVHAWINPYRISNSNDLSVISKTNPAYKWIGTNNIGVFSNGIYYNPASPLVHDLIISVVKEIVTNYQVDGIHFDDYFYPNETIDLENYKEYIEKGGTLSIKDYRLNIINNLVSDVYKTIKELNKNVVFGISPEGNINNNYNNNYADVKTWLSKSGYVDYIMPQIYFGLLNQYQPYIDTVSLWNSLIKDDSIQLIPALAFYKNGNIDRGAGSGSNEWLNNDNVIMKQIIIGRNLKNYSGFALFRYDYLFNKYYLTNNTILERINIIKLLE